MTNVQSREYQDQTDFWRVRDFLVAAYAMNRNHHNWDLVRWDYWRYFVTQLPRYKGWQWEAEVRLWETEAGELVGAVHPEDKGIVSLQIHPDYRHLEGDMLAWAEAHLAAPTEEGKRRVKLSVCEYDTRRQDLLARRGYQKDEADFGFTRCRSMDRPIPKTALPPGYTVRSLRAGDDILERRAVSSRAFGSDSTDGAAVYRSLQAAPGYHMDLDMVAVEPGGKFAAFCLGWFDEVNRFGVFEPVGTDPDHRRKGLAGAVMNEALRRLKAMGATLAYVGCLSDVPANGLYESLGFTEYDKDVMWWKEL